jgi:hypothetical protein
MTYPTAIGCGCLLGAGGASHVLAAQWSLQPILSWTLDYDSSRFLAPNGSGSEQAVLSADVLLQRSIENMQLTLEPHFDLRRFSDSGYGPGDDRNVTGTFAHSSERTQLSLTASLANQSTLTTELLQTGIISANTRRRTETASAELDLARTEEHLFFTQLSYLGSSYSGSAYVEEVLPGYRYESAAVGERFVLSEHLTLSPSAFGDILHSDRAGGSSHEEGLQVDFKYAHSERTSFDLQLGESRRYLSTVVGNPTSLAAATFATSASNGTNVSASATRNFELSSLSFSYSRSLVPYGNGFLVQRQQITATARRSLTPAVDTDFSVTRIQNNDSTVRLGLDRRYYNNGVAGLNWRVGETWTLRSEVSTSWTPPIGSSAVVHEWRAALTMTWKPNPQVMSR